MESDNSLPKSSFSISELGFKGGKYVYSASLVCLINVAQSALDEILPTTAFGKKFYELVGSTVQDFLTSLKTTYEDYHISNVSSLDYRVSEDVWFLESQTRAHIRGGNTPLSKASLVSVLTALVSQLRQRVFRLHKARLQSEFSTGLKDCLDDCLRKIPPQKEKNLLVRKRKEKNENDDQEEEVESEDDGEDDTSKMQTITVKYEPFVDQVAGAFSEASKAQRIVINKEREVRDQQRNKEKDSGWNKVSMKGNRPGKR